MLRLVEYWQLMIDRRYFIASWLVQQSPPLHHISGNVRPFNAFFLFFGEQFPELLLSIRRSHVDVVDLVGQLLYADDWVLLLSW